MFLHFFHDHVYNGVKCALTLREGFNNGGVGFPIVVGMWNYLIILVGGLCTFNVSGFTHWGSYGSMVYVSVRFLILCVGPLIFTAIYRLVGCLVLAGTYVVLLGHVVGIDFIRVFRVGPIDIDRYAIHSTSSYYFSEYFTVYL